MSEETPAQPIRGSSVQDQPRVLILARTGLIIRNLILGPFGFEAENSAELVVAVPKPDDPQLVDRVKRRRVSLIPFPLAKTTGLTRREQVFSWQTYIYRFRQAEKATQSMQVQTRLFETTQSRFKRVTGGALLWIGRLLVKTRLMGRIERGYLKRVRSWAVTREWEALLTRERPAAVLSTVLTLSTLRRPSDDLPALVAAHKLGIPCGTLVQSWDNLSSKTAVLPPWVARYWSWSPAMSKELLQLHPRIEPQSVEVVGSPHFDFHHSLSNTVTRAEHFERLELDPSRPLIVIGTGTRMWLPEEPTTAANLAATIRRHLTECQVLLRLHPKDDGTRWEDLRPRLAGLQDVKFQITAPDVHMDEGGFSDPLEFYRELVATLKHASVVINTASTLTVDASILDRPVISIDYDDVADARFPEGRSFAFNRSTHFAPLVALGGVDLASSDVEAIRLVSGYLEDDSRRRDGRRKIAEYVAGYLDGCCGSRLAESLVALGKMKCESG